VAFNERISYDDTEVVGLALSMWLQEGGWYPASSAASSDVQTDEDGAN
jgi:hypothetical protein